MRQRLSLVLLLVIVLVAASLRFYRLDAQSFWNDEGNSARIAERTLGLILEGAAGDIHPPGYYLLLHWWRAVFGESEFAIRSFSAAAGVALVALTYLLGCRLFGDATGLSAAFLGAISPFAVYYSQEARMYALLAALSAASTWLFLRFLAAVQHPACTKSRIWAVATYVFTSAAGMYTHYAFAFILLVQSVIFGLWWVTVALRSGHRWRWLALWAGAQGAVIAVYLPWLPSALRSVAGWSPAGRAYELGPALVDVFRVLGIGVTLPAGEGRAALVCTGILLLAGSWPAFSQVRRTLGGRAEGRRQLGRTPWFGVASTVVYLLLPIALFFVFDLYKPAWLKFLVIILPPFHLLMARGVENASALAVHALRSTGHASRTLLQPLGVAVRFSLIGLAAVLLFPSLQNLYFDPAYARDDYRQLVADLEAIRRLGDAVILSAPNQWEVFTYYYRGEDVYPAPYRPEPAGVKAFVGPLLDRYERLFVLYWGEAESDPGHLVERRLVTHAYKASGRWYGNVRVATYAVAPLPDEPAVAVDARFGESIGLRGYAVDTRAFSPGDIVPVTLFWEAWASISDPYKVSVQVLSDEGRLVGQVDSQPKDGLAPTGSWEPGEALTDRYGVLLPADVPLGRCPVIVVLYHAMSGERLPVVLDGEPVGDHLSLGDVLVEPG